MLIIIIIRMMVFDLISCVGSSRWGTAHAENHCLLIDLRWREREKKSFLFLDCLKKKVDMVGNNNVEQLRLRGLGIKSGR